MAISTGAALLGAAVVGGISSASAASKASSAANAQTAAATEATAASLEFQKQQYEDWKGTFGDVQETLSKYYSNMDPDVLAAANIQAINQQYTQAKTNLDQTLAQRGLATSGAAAQGNVQLEQSAATARASAIANAPIQAAQEQMNFLRAGLGLESSITSNISSAYSNQAQTALGLAGQQNQLAAAAGKNVGSAIGSGLNAYSTYNALNPTVANPAVVSDMSAGGYGGFNSLAEAASAGHTGGW